MSKWDKIVQRDKLQAFPCIADLHLLEAGDDQCEDPNFAPCPDPGRCALRPIYEEYMAMRAVVDAELSVSVGTTPDRIANGWRNYAGQRHVADGQRKQAIKRADAWDGLT